MKRITVLTTLTALLALWTIVVFGAVPQLINFQGILRDGSGNPVANSSYSVVFSIYAGPTGGSALWSETQSVTTSGGLFTILLGNSAPVPDSVFNDSSRYLGIKVGADLEMTPRQKLSSVGFGYRVGSVDGAAGGSINGTLSFGSSTAPILYMFDVAFPSTSRMPLSHSSFFPDWGLGYSGPDDKMKFQGGAGNDVMTVDLLGQKVEIGAPGGVFIGTLATPTQLTHWGNFNLVNSSASAGNILKGGVPFIHNFGPNNTFIGLNAGNLTMTGGSNTASGRSALLSNTTGSGNTASGASALFSNTDGIQNTASGVSALQSNTTGNGNTASGVSALFSNTTGNSNTASGGIALVNNTTGNSNTAIGRAALGSNNTGNFNTAIGFGANVSAGDLINATAIGANAVVDASNKIRLGDANVTVIEGQVAYTFPSDRNQKENFRPVDGEEVLRKIRGFELSSWNYKGHDPKEFRHYGPMAQDFFAAFGDDGVGKIGTETTLNSGDVAGVLMIAVQALGNENAELKTRIEQLEKQVKKMQAEKPQAGVR